MGAGKKGGWRGVERSDRREKYGMIREQNEKCLDGGGQQAAWHLGIRLLVLLEPALPARGGTHAFREWNASIVLGQCRFG